MSAPAADTSVVSSRGRSHHKAEDSPSANTKEVRSHERSKSVKKHRSQSKARAVTATSYEAQNSLAPTFVDKWEDAIKALKTGLETKFQSVTLSWVVGFQINEFAMIALLSDGSADVKVKIHITDNSANERMEKVEMRTIRTDIWGYEDSSSGVSRQILIGTTHISPLPSGRGDKKNHYKSKRFTGYIEILEGLMGYAFNM